MTQATSIDAQHTIEWLNKLIMLAQWDKKLPFHVVRLVSDRPAYQEFLTRVSSGATEQEDKTEETPETIARQKLLAAIASVPTLKELFAAEADPFKDAPPDHLQLLAEVSDITVKPPQIIYSRNGTLIAVVEALRQSPELNAESLIADGLNKFFTLMETRESVAKMLFELAQSPHWYVVLASLREDRDYTREEDATVRKILGDWQGKMTTELRKLLFMTGHLSRAPKKLIEMAWTHRQLFDEARKAIPANARKTDDEIEERRQVTNEALALFAARAKPAYDGIKADLNVLATVARHYVNVRKFAKLDGFVYTWPDIARLAMSNYAALKYVEDLLVNRKPLPADADPDAQELYRLCEKNERLIRFLRLRPYFGEINDNELRSYQPLAPVVVTDTPPTVDSVRGADFPVAEPLSPPPAVKTFSVMELMIARDIARDEVGPPSPQTSKYKVMLTDTLARVSLGEAPVTFSVQKLLERILGAMGVTSDVALHEVLKELFSSAPAVAESRMARGGAALAKELLFPTVDKSEKGDVKPSTLLSRIRPLRIVVRAGLEDLHYLPWEWLTTGSAKLPWLSSPDFSLVRANHSAEEITPVALYPPVRILSIFPDAPSGERGSSESLVKALQGVINVDTARYKVLVGAEAGLPRVFEALETFNPHMVHFEGYFRSEESDGMLKLVSSQTAMSVDKFGALLKQRGVQLLVMGKNSMNRIYANTGALAAFMLSREGLPAIIAPMRAIDEQSSLNFTTEFYSAFLKGISLEAALHSARRSTAAKGGDWSAFALFADPSRLDDFQLHLESA